LAADSTIFTLGPMIRVNINEASMEYIIKKIITILSLKNDGYKNKGLNSIIFHYGFVDGVAPNTKNNVLEKSGIYQNYRHYKLPFFLDPLKYGLLLHEEDRLEQGHFYILQNNNGNTFKILQTIDPITGLIHNNVELFRQGITGLVYTDQEISNGIFTRTIGSNKYYCSLDKGMEFFHTIKQNKFIKTGKIDNALNQDIITLDLETYQTKVQGQVRLMPYLISFYDGVTSISNYLTDFANSDLMILDCLNQLISIKYDGFKVYVHNLSNFDSLFMLNILQNNFDINLTRNKGRIISMKVSKTVPNPLFRDKEKVISLTFYDSYQLLPSSLRKLGLSFNTITQKDIFPYNFVNKDNLNYIGPVPSIEFFPLDTFSSIAEYNSYKMNNFPFFDWNLKQISIDYCNKDCISLHQVLIKFSQLIWDKYHINITKFPTLTSLTFSIFRTHFLGNNKIPMLAGKFYTDIKMAYTGGATDMYIPTNMTKNNTAILSSSSILSKVFKNAWKVICILYYYDVNSLYPYIMSQFELPCGKIVYFEGNIYNPDLVINNIIPQGVLGFYYCKVKAPLSLLHPIIQLRVDHSTIAPVGEFECMLYSVEIENARKYGYEITVLRGYYFTEKVCLFKDYIKQLYTLRLEYNKSHPMNLIAKLLMNSLYGRFGMDYSLEQTSIVNNIEINDLLNNNNINRSFNKNIIDIEPLGKNNFIVTQECNNINDKISSLNHHHNINVGVAAGVTALARVYMSKFKNNPLIKLFYTDTDSIFTDKSPEQMNTIFNDIIGNKLGQLKLECVINRAVFLAPKAYCLELVNQEQIIKIKGLNSNVIKNLMGENVLTLDTFIKVLSMDYVEIVNQHKTIKNLLEGSLDIIEQAYTI
jgi:hypothetical protein